MPTINEFTINGAAVNGGESPSLPATVEEICLPCVAAWELPILLWNTVAEWERVIDDSIVTAAWEIEFDAAIGFC